MTPSIKDFKIVRNYSCEKCFFCSNGSYNCIKKEYSDLFNKCCKIFGNCFTGQKGIIYVLKNNIN